MKTRTKVLTGIMAILLSCVLLFTIVVVGNNTNKSGIVVAKTRTVELSELSVDAQSVLNEFENSTLTKNGTTVYFEGFKPLDTQTISEIDYISDKDFEELENCVVKYNFSYDTESNIVTLAAAATLLDGSIEIDEIKGVGFINANNEIDAVMNIDGEGILLSEMRDAGMIQNCGWFSNLIKKVVKAVTVVAVIAVTAAVVVATAGAAAPALVAVGVGTTSACLGSAAVGVAAGALFAATVGKAAVKAGTAVGEKLGDRLEVVVDKVSKHVMAFCFDNIEYLMRQVTKSNIKDFQENGKIYLCTIGTNGNTYLSSNSVSHTVAVWFMRISKYSNYVSIIGTGTYTVACSDAWDIAYDAGNGLLPVEGGVHGKSTETKLYFEHWHDAKHLGHSFWGNPV